MNIADTFVPPTVTDGDICHASRLLGLPVDAFYGADGTDPRQTLLKCMKSVDVAACPGSGKTTLLVAKLAVLAEKWQYRTRGICVLSHTNAARHEIEKHLGNTSTGRQLLGYPHYIGTIHGFITEFLATPWLRSQGYPIKMIDTDVCLRRRWFSLPYKTRSALENNSHEFSALSVQTPDFGVGEVRWGKKGLLGTNTPSYSDIRDACRRSAIDGYFCYDEMFMWAKCLISTGSGVVDVLRNRFPILLIDEAQDNNKVQTEILNLIFMEGDMPVIRQRFGDANQAIFDFQGAQEASVDKFPSGQVIELPNSHRFGQTIADLADPLGIQPYQLQGVGPKNLLVSGTSSGQHTVFLFDESSAGRVLAAYGALLLETFSDLELSQEWFTAAAVGQVHRPPDEDKAHKSPHHVGHYWSDYQPELTKLDPKPRSFIQYVLAGQGTSELQGESHAMVEKIAEGLVRLSDFGMGGKFMARRQHAHRHVLQSLEASPQTRKQYKDLVVQLTLHKDSLSIHSWNAELSGVIRGIAEVLAGSKLSDEANPFLAWSMESTASVQTPIESRNRNNLFAYRENGREVFIQAGSIHSVKGQTHTATLVLETFWYDHNIEHILPWFTGNKHGWKRADGSRQESRLKLHYVAMTRPTHLLCLAIKRSTLKDEHIRAIQSRGWRIAHVKSDGSTVLLDDKI